MTAQQQHAQYTYWEDKKQIRVNVNRCAGLLHLHNDCMWLVCVYSNLLMVESVCLFKRAFNGAIPSVRHTLLNSLWTDWQCASWTAQESEVWIMFEHEKCMSTAVLNRDLLKYNLENDSENGFHDVFLDRFTRLKQNNWSWLFLFLNHVI